MKKSTTSNLRPLLRALPAFLIAFAALWAAPRNACAQLYLTNRPVNGLGMVSEYNATSGEVINANLITGLNNPLELAVKGNRLFVVNSAAPGSPGFVGKYDATTGATINANFITGLSLPFGLAVKSAK